MTTRRRRSRARKLTMMGTLGPTRVFWRWETTDWTELEFIKWAPRSLIVRFPSSSRYAGQRWLIGWRKALYWKGLGALRVEGDRATWFGYDRKYESTEVGA